MTIDVSHSHILHSGKGQGGGVTCCCRYFALFNGIPEDCTCDH